MAIRLLNVGVWASTIAAVAARGIGTECDGLGLRDFWLVGNCLTGTGSTRIESSTYLASKISNSEAKLIWQTNGNFQQSCSSCRLGGSVLTCNCKSTWNGPRDTSIDLAEHIGNYEGHLLSNLTGPPKVPDGSSSVPVPADPKWSLSYGETSCYSTEPQVCPETPPAGNQGCDASPLWISAGPYSCYSFHWPTSAPMWQSFKSLSPGSPSNGWQFKIYTDHECKGKLIQTITGSEANKCWKFPDYGVGVSAMPLWNSDT